MAVMPYGGNLLLGVFFVFGRTTLAEAVKPKYGGNFLEVTTLAEAVKTKNGGKSPCLEAGTVHLY